MILDGKKIAREIFDSIERDVTELRSNGIVPGLGIVLVGNDPASRLYVSIKKREATRLGMRCHVVEYEEDVELGLLFKAIDTLNADKNIHGIIVQIPLPKRLDRDSVCRRIALSKDVDCLNPDSLKALESGEEALPPPVAESVRLLIDAAGVSVAQKKMAVIGSGLFARQIAHYCRNLGASVEQMSAHALQEAPLPLDAEILVTAVGKAHIVTRDMASEHMIVIDVGVSKREAQTVGDIDFEHVKDLVQAITPVPGGVGPVTVACLLNNVVAAAKKLLT